MHEPLLLEKPGSPGIVLFIHGFMGSPHQFEALVELAREQEVSAASLLLPGHGAGSDEFKKSTKAMWQEHVDSALKRFSGEYERILLVGHSMGGLLSINAAVKQPEHVKGLMLICSPFKLASFSPRMFEGRRVQAFAREERPIQVAFNEGAGVEAGTRTLWHVIKPATDFLRVMHATKENLPKLRAPVTAFYSTGDEIVSIKSLDILRTGLTGTMLEGITLKDSDHAYFPLQEREMIENTLIERIRTLLVP